jgi:cytochrome b6-f complex iron-sulfur subunit/menaquinol-cytochrome c reductase iron-sulfur subunit
MANDESRPGRRALLVAVAGVAAIPCARLIGHAPLDSGARGWLRLAKVNDLVEAQPKRFAVIVDRRDGWVVEKSAEIGAVWLFLQRGQPAALSASCPHLGCGIRSTEAGFACGCHDTTFDGAGKRVRGPAPRDLDALETRVSDGEVLVRFVRFRSGIEARVEVG